MNTIKPFIIKPFINVVRDPTRTDQIFKVISNPFVTNAETFAIVNKHLRATPKCAAMLDSRHLGNWDLNELALLPKGTLGQVYAKHMLDNGLDSDFFPRLDVVSDHAYLQMRSRQTHDIWHVVTGFNTSVADEVGLQAFSYAQMPSPASITIITMFLLHACFFKRDQIGAIMAAIARGWTLGSRAESLMGERFEDMWSVNLEDYRRQLKLN